MTWTVQKVRVMTAKGGGSGGSALVLVTPRSQMQLGPWEGKNIDVRIKTQQAEINRHLVSLSQLQQAKGLKSLPAQQQVLQQDLQKLKQPKAEKETRQQQPADAAHWSEDVL